MSCTLRHGLGYHGLGHVDAQQHAAHFHLRTAYLQPGVVVPLLQGKRSHALYPTGRWIVRSPCQPYSLTAFSSGWVSSSFASSSAGRKSVSLAPIGKSVIKIRAYLSFPNVAYLPALFLQQKAREAVQRYPSFVNGLAYDDGRHPGLRQLLNVGECPHPATGDEVQAGLLFQHGAVQVDGARPTCRRAQCQCISPCRCLAACIPSTKGIKSCSVVSCQPPTAIFPSRTSAPSMMRSPP